MPSTNGHGPRRAVLYARVSTEEQARSGYSLAQQIEALRAYAAREGYEVLEEVSDPGQSGASLERPGMDRVRDLVAAGGVSAVLSQDRDRFSREPAYTYLLRREFEEHGAKLKALNDRGDESPEGQLTDGILDQLAKYERAKIAERSRRGKLRKAREGKLIASHTPHYGFRYTPDREHYELDEEAMFVVRRIFGLVGGEKLTLHAVKKALERERVPAPNGGALWDPTTLRGIVLEDVYLTHTHAEMAELVSPQVAAALEPGRGYGVVWHNRRKTTIKHVREGGTYKKTQKATVRPRSEWIAVPGPDAGIPRELVEAARQAVLRNGKASWTGGRPWELSGGVLICGGCGRRMVPNRKRNSAESGKVYGYYRCPKRQRHGAAGCPQGKSYRADRLERQVWDYVRDYLTDPERLRADLDRMIELRQQEVRGDPEQEMKAWLDRLEELDRKREGYWDLAAGGDMPKDLMRAKVAELEDEREAAERELGKLRERHLQIEELKQDRDALLRELEGNAPEMLEGLSPEERNRFYKILRFTVTAHPDGLLEARLPFDAPAFRVHGEDQANTWVTGQVFGVDGGLSTLRPLPRRPSKSSS